MEAVESTNSNETTSKVNLMPFLTVEGKLFTEKCIDIDNSLEFQKINFPDISSISV